MPSFGQILPYLAAPLAQTVAASNQADLAAKLRQRKEAIEDQAIKRQQNEDRLNLITKLAPIGGRLLPAGVDANSTAAALTSRNNMASGMNAEGTAPSAIPNSALGITEDQTPDYYGKPSTVSIGDQNILIDPSQSNQALAARHEASVIAAQNQRESAKEAAALTRQQNALDAAKSAATRAANGDFLTLQGLDPNHPLVKAGFNPDYAASYAREAQALHAQNAEQARLNAAKPQYEWAVDPNDQNAKPQLLPKDEISRRGFTQPPKAAGGGSASLSPEDRQKMMNQAALDNQTMKEYENKVMQSGKVPGFVAGAAGVAASAAPTGVIGGITGLIGNKATGVIDPDYQRYITAQRSYGRIMGNLQSKRYTDHQAEIERSISGLQGNDLNSTIQYKQNLRDQSLADAGGHAGSTPSLSGGGRAGGGGSQLTPAQIQRAQSDPEYAAFLKATGKIP